MSALKRPCQADTARHRHTLSLQPGRERTGAI